MMEEQRSIEVRGTVDVGPAGYWTPAVHALLDHLHDSSFDRAPRSISYDDVSEVVSYLPGQTIGDRYVHPWTSEEHLVSVARLLRSYHDAAAGFVPPSGARWQETSMPTTGTLICHNDLYRGNVVFRDGRAVGLIDFDFAHPAEPVCDVAVAAWHWVLLSDCWPTDVPVGRWPHRLRVFVEAYGLGDAERHDLLRHLTRFLQRVLVRAQSTRNGVDRAEQDLTILRQNDRALRETLSL